MLFGVVPGIVACGPQLKPGVRHLLGNVRFAVIRMIMPSSYNSYTMTILEGIRTKIRDGQFEFSQHAVDQSIIRHISVQELREAIAESTIIEDYPDDKYGPSCLLLGLTHSRRPVHIQCSYPSRPLVKIITLYEPDPQRWIDWKIRRRQDAAGTVERSTDRAEGDV